MPAKKPSSLLNQHDSKAVRMTRANSEAAFQSKDPLLLKPPATLKEYPGAGALWKRTIKMYRSLDATIVSALDQGLLEDYCVLGVQLVEMDDLRTAARKNLAKAQALLNRISAKKNTDPKTLIQLQNSVNRTEGTIVKIDARVDRKRALLHTLRQSLYLTPRSRAGVAPKEKPLERPKTDMEKLLDY